MPRIASSPPRVRTRCSVCNATDEFGPSPTTCARSSGRCRTTGAGASGAAARRGDISIEYRLVRADGGIRWLASRGSTVCASDGSKRVIGALFDITERKTAEAALARALGDKGALLAQKEMLLKEMNHRVKNSLQAVSAMLRLQAANSRDRLLRRFLLEADQRVLIIARVHEHFYKQAEAADRIEAAQYLHELCGSLERTASSSMPTAPRWRPTRRWLSPCWSTNW